MRNLFHALSNTNFLGKNQEVQFTVINVASFFLIPAEMHTIKR
jgi:hypothetical protein